MEVITTLKNLDTELFLFLNSLHNTFWDVVMVECTKKETWVPFYLVVVWFIIRNYRKKAIVIIIILFLSVILSDQISVFFKETVQRLRPSHEALFEGLIHNPYKRGGLYSFFSGHATNTFSFAMLSSLLFKNRFYSLAIFLWAALVSYTRVYIGVHYPFDILTGMCCGMLIGFTLYKLMLISDARVFPSGLPRIKSTGMPTPYIRYILIALALMVVIIMGVVPFFK